MAEISKTEWLKNAMAKMGWTAEEAEAVWNSDREIDKGKAQDFDLSKEQLKIAQKFAKTGTRKTLTAYKFTTRERKANPTKASIIAEIARFLQENSENACENVEITNKERQIAFKIGENAYELTLVQKRKPKS